MMGGDGLVTFIQASAHDMPQVATGSVQCIVTSPPYYGLRVYSGVQDVEWPAVEYAPMPGLPPLTVPPMRSPLGNEPTLEAYIGHLVLCLREWRRVLRDDGVCFVNLGDTYAANRPGGQPAPTNTGNRAGYLASDKQGVISIPTGLKPKDLMLVPHRFALAAQADGWWVRSDIIGAKVAPMPESVTDRPTRSHEHIWMLTKAAKYFWDAEAVREKALDSSVARMRRGVSETNKLIDGAPGQVPHTVHQARSNDPDREVSTSRQMRDVIEWRPKPFPGAHFAVWPEAIPERFIRAGTSERGCCPHCGAPWARVVEGGFTAHNGNTASQYGEGTTANRLAMLRQAARENGGEYANARQTIGFAPSCTCNHEGIAYRPDDLDLIATPTGERTADDPTLQTGRAGMNRPRGDNEGSRPITRHEQRCYAVQLQNAPQREQMEAQAGPAFAHYVRLDSSGARPVPQELLEQWIAAGWIEHVTIPEFTPYPPVPCVVLDPFSGSGTTAKVAVRLGRRAIGVDISSEYLTDVTAQRFGAGVQMELTGAI